MASCVAWMQNVDDTKAKIDKLQALEMWIWRRLENISWEQKIRNEEMLRRVKENRCFITTIQYIEDRRIG